MSLYIVSTPIGHPDDITYRAVKVLQEVDFVICEEYKEGSKLLKRLDIKKELFSINEHNEQENADEILSMLKSGKSAALVSDCGTPLFADPGTFLVGRCHQSGIQVVPVPGASSLLSALAVAGVDSKKFYYAGFLPRKSDERREAIRDLLKFDCSIVVYDTPYRMKQLLEDLHAEAGDQRQVTLAIGLTMKEERVVKGDIKKVLKEIKAKPIKKEFVLIIDPIIRQQRDRKPRKFVKTRKRR